MSEQVTYLYTVKYRGAINIASMRVFTDLESLKEHYQKKNSWDWVFVYQFAGIGPATLIPEKKLEELFK